MGAKRAETRVQRAVGRTVTRVQRSEARRGQFLDGSGGDGSLNPNSTYKDWIWLLVRNKQGEWKHVDHGY